MRRLGFIPPVLLATLLASCGDPSSTEPDASVATSIALTPSSLSMSSPGETVQLTATVMDQTGVTLPNASVVWSSDDVGVADVSEDGLVTAMGYGSARVSAAVGSVSASAPVTVETAPETQAVELLSGLSSPWGMDQLPDGRFLITQKGGSFVVLASTGETVLSTIPSPFAVASGGQGGLLDVVLDPDFDQNSTIYWTFSEPGVGAESGLFGTAVGAATLVGDALQNVAVIYRQHPKTSGQGHYGSRLVFRSDGTLFVTLGDRQLGSPAQDATGTLGKVVRINRDGSVPADNPRPTGWAPEIWSMGHRNPQGAALRPGTDDLWLVEHGPQGGDELNLVAAGANHGWPVVSYGCPYGSPVGDACRIGGGTHAPQYVEPVSYWVPLSIAPAGMIFYGGDRFPGWRDNVILGALAGRAVWRVSLAGDVEASRQELFADLGERIRDIHEGLDGWIYLVTDSGRFIQIRN
ncbi:MAG: PQQ-dependent sugar dehydrogenase [Gemmatimonadota bacterium]|nr:PQQ-dependent sugar dehydrogenase [Gemmatimonadota bacterium]